MLALRMAECFLEDGHSVGAVGFCHRCSSPYEVGMIKNSPQKIIGQGTNGRFWRELKKS